MKPQISSRDLKSLSLFLDDQLSTTERQRLEHRLQEEQTLKRALDEMRQTRLLLRSVPRLRAPHSFTLTQQMLGIKERKPLFPVMGFVAALASFLFVLVLAGDLLGASASLTKQVAMQPVLEAAIPTQAMADESRAQTEITAPSVPEETQAEGAMALKAIAPPSDVLQTESSQTLSSDVLGAGQEMGGTPTLEENYAKEAPAPAAIAPLETSTPEGTATLDENEAALTAQAPSQNQMLSTEMAGVAGFSDTPSVGPGISQDQTEVRNEVLAARPEEGPVEGPTLHFTLRVLEAVLAVTALVTAALFFIQRRK
jgi:hypothetical protein